MRDEIRSKRLRVRSINSEEHVADLGTKPLSKAVIAKHRLALRDVNMAEESVSCKKHKTWRCVVTSFRSSGSRRMAGQSVRRAQQVTMSRRFREQSEAEATEAAVAARDAWYPVDKYIVQQPKTFD